MPKNSHKSLTLIVALVGLLYSCTQRKHMNTTSDKINKEYQLIWEDNFTQEKCAC